MKFHARHSISRQNPAGGFTLAEMLVAVGAGFILLTSVAALSLYGAKSFLAMGNYVDLDDQSRNALDVICREVRDASAVVSFNTNSPMSLTLTNATLGVTITLTNDPNGRTLTLLKTGLPAQTLLQQCDQWSFSLYDRAPLISSTNIIFPAATNGTGALDPTFVKLINMSWRCSRTILQQKVNTESVQTAQIVLRNKVK